MKNKFAVARRAALGVLIVFAVLFASCATELIEVVYVNFDADGGTPAPVQRELMKGAALGSVPTPTKTEDGVTYEFNGWFSGFDRYTATSEVYNDITLIARWKNPNSLDTVFITFNANQTGAVPAVTVVEVEVGKKLGPLYPVDPRRNGRDFLGWETPTGTLFDRDSVATETMTVKGTWAIKTTLYTVTLEVPAIHQPANPGIHGKSFQVYAGDCIDEWRLQFPAEMSQADDPNDFQMHIFFRWTENGSESGIIYTGRTPIEKNVRLGAVYGLHFKKETFDIDLSTMYSHTSMNEFRDGPWWDELPSKYKDPMSGAEDVITTPVRNPRAKDPTFNPDGSVSFTVTDKATIVWFRPPEGLWKLLQYGEIANNTKVSFSLDYEYADPSHDTDSNNLLNIFFGNLKQNDNWNATEVRDLTMRDISYGIGYESGDTPVPELHNLIGTVINFDQNIDWIIFRLGRGDNYNIASQTLTIKGFKVTLEQ